jgi:HAD superfamily hydrolase (TIGR01490 family)
MRAAVFDVDRTLLPRTTAERIFVRRLWREGELGWRQALAGLLFSLQRPGPALLRDWRAERPYLRGLDARRIAALARRCFEDEIRPRLARRGLERLRQHRTEGAVTVLLSGSLADLIEPMGAYVGADVTIASRLRVIGSRIAGGLEGPHPHGATKAALIQQLVRERAIELAASFCYADDHTDVPMLSLFGHPVCVNPSEQLRRLAQRHGWPVEDFA